MSSNAGTIAKAVMATESTQVDLSHIPALLGTWYPEPALKQLLDSLGMSEAPRLPKDSMSTHLIRHDLGVEITFTDERLLDYPQRAYPEGALVLKNIRFYGAKTADFSPFSGSLPHGLQFGATLAQLSALIGKPAWFDEDLAKARWDLPDLAVLANFNDNGQSNVYSFQPPVSDD